MHTPSFLTIVPGTLIAAAALAGCGSTAAPAGGDSTTADSTTVASTTASGCATDLPPLADVERSFAQPFAQEIDVAKTYTATIDTTCGTIVARLAPREAPKTVNNFVALARRHYFDGVRFHRVVADFVIQGGDPEGTGRGGPGYTFADELPKSGYRIGDLAMANAGPDTNGSQFFVITGADGATLDLNYSRFGAVTSGLEVAQRIEGLANPNATNDPATQQPTQAVAIRSVVITEG